MCLKEKNYFVVHEECGSNISMLLSVVSDHNRTLPGAARWSELGEQRFGEGSA